MSPRTIQTSHPGYIIAVTISLSTVVPLLHAQQPLQFNTIYTCKGTRVIVRSCALGNADNPANDCIVQFPDRPRNPATGNMATTLMLHSVLVKTIQTCAMGGAAGAQPLR